MGSEPLYLAGNKVACDDTLGFAVDYDKVKHLVTGIACYCTVGNLLVQGSIGSEKKLLSGLPAGIEGTAHLYATEGTVGKISAIFPGERNSLSYALVDNRSAYLCKTVNIGFAAAIVPAFDCIVEKTIYGVVVVLIVLSGIYTSLSRNRMGTAGRIAYTEHLYVISQLTKGSSRGSTAKSCTHNDNLKLALVVGVDKMHFLLAPRPFLLQRAFGNLRN